MMDSMLKTSSMLSTNCQSDKSHGRTQNTKVLSLVGVVCGDLDLPSTLYD